MLLTNRGAFAIESAEFPVSSTLGRVFSIAVNQILRLKAAGNVADKISISSRMSNSNQMLTLLFSFVFFSFSYKFNLCKTAFLHDLMLIQPNISFISIKKSSLKNSI